MGQWLMPQVEGISPAPRGGHASVAIGRRFIVFGGADRAPTTFNDLWVLETVDGRYEWTIISTRRFGGRDVPALAGATITAVQDRVYLFGGQNPLTGDCFNDVLMLDTVRWEWSELEVQGGKPPPRHSHSTGLLHENCLLVFGGAGMRGPLGDVWIFNIPQGVWTRPNVAGPPPAPREMHSGVMLGSGKMVVYGGRGPDGRVLNDVAVLDADEMCWSKQEATPFARCAHAAVALPAADVQPAPQHAASESTPAADSTCVVVCGGFSGEDVEGDVLWIDPSTLQTEVVTKPPHGVSSRLRRFAHSAAAIPSPDGQEHMVLLVFGGVNPKEDLQDIAIWHGFTDVPAAGSSPPPASSNSLPTAPEPSPLPSPTSRATEPVAKSPSPAAVLIPASLPVVRPPPTATLWADSEEAGPAGPTNLSVAGAMASAAGGPIAASGPTTGAEFSGTAAPQTLPPPGDAAVAPALPAAGAAAGDGTDMDASTVAAPVAPLLPPSATPMETGTSDAPLLAAPVTAGPSAVGGEGMTVSGGVGLSRGVDRGMMDMDLDGLEDLVDGIEDDFDKVGGM